MFDFLIEFAILGKKIELISRKYLILALGGQVNEVEFNDQMHKLDHLNDRG